MQTVWLPAVLLLWMFRWLKVTWLVLFIRMKPTMLVLAL